MRVARYYRNDDVRLEEMERPAAGPGELLLRVHASGICGSDVMEWYRVPKAPLVLGHEIAGEVVEVGAGVTRFREGDRVMATHHVPCNTCRHCLRGHHTLCDTLRTTRFDPGGFAEYLRLPAINVDRGTFLLPDRMTDEEASFLEPLACAVRALRVSRLSPGDSVLVLGSGISGILQLQLARAYGAGFLAATDLRQYRLDLAMQFGADLALQADDDVPARFREANGGRGADQVIVCAAAPAAIDQAIAAVERGGTILFFALFPPGYTHPLPLHELGKEGISIVHSYGGAPADIEKALELIAGHRVDVASMVSHRLPLAETGEGFRLVVEADRSLKVIVDPRR